MTRCPVCRGPLYVDPDDRDRCCLWCGRRFSPEAPLPLVKRRELDGYRLDRRQPV